MQRDRDRAVLAFSCGHCSDHAGGVQSAFPHSSSLPQRTPFRPAQHPAGTSPARRLHIGLAKAGRSRFLSPDVHANSHPNDSLLLAYSRAFTYLVICFVLRWLVGVSGKIYHAPPPRSRCLSPFDDNAAKIASRTARTTPNRQANPNRTICL